MTTVALGSIEARAPKCFGSPTSFAFESSVCNTCIAFKACADASMVRLEKIKAKFPVQSILDRHVRQRNKLFADQAPVVKVALSSKERMKIRIRHEVEALKGDRANLHAAVAAGRNPFNSNAPHLRSALDAIRAGGEVQASVRDWAMKDIRMSRDKASDVAMIAIATLKCLGIAVASPNGAALSPALVRHTESTQTQGVTA